MKIVLLVVCLVIQETISGRVRWVIGGYPIDILKVPYQVSVRNRSIHLCGGALISQTHILTVAHCVAGRFKHPYYEITVVTGTNRVQDGGTHHNVKNIKLHDKFRREDLRNDIAVLTLSAGVTINDKQTPIKLPSKGPRYNVSGIVAGFGRRTVTDPCPSNILYGYTTTILDKTTCRKYYGKKWVRKENICGLQEKGKGDSGGALVYNETIVGLVSWAGEYAAGEPDVYVMVYQYLKFIKKVMKGRN